MVAMDSLLVYRDEALDGATNMARDEHLLHNPDIAPAALRVYGWSPPTISLGYFQRFEDVARLPDEVQGLAVVRRQTGGGAILHDREVTYCLVIGADLPVARRAPDALYRLAHQAWAEALRTGGRDTQMAPDSYPMPSPRTGPFFCFEKPGRTDLMIDGGKLLGSAQRRMPRVPEDHQGRPAGVAGRVLQHGSLLLGRRFAAHPGHDLGEPPPAAVEQWVSEFINRVARALALDPEPASWSADQLADVSRRRERYAGDAWTRRR